MPPLDTQRGGAAVAEAAPPRPISSALILLFAVAAGAVAALLMAAVAQSAWTFLLASLLIGVTSSAAQMLVPIAAHLAPAESRGRGVGKGMSGLLLGILLARPIASILADTLGWRSVFVLSAALMAADAHDLPELRGEELRLALLALGRVAGTVDVEMVLDLVFSEFCIGK